MALVDELREFIGPPDQTTPQTTPLEFFERSRALLRTACARGGRCDALGDNRGEGHLAYMYAANTFANSGFAAAAEALLIEWWNDCGHIQLTERQRVYRAVISNHLADLYLRTHDDGAALWWTLHTQADDILGQHEHGGGAGKEKLRTIMGMSEEALEELNSLTSQNRRLVEEQHMGDWGQPWGFPEDAILRFALRTPAYATLFTRESSIREYPLAQAYFRALLSRLDSANTSVEKGLALEDIASYLFLLIPGWVPSRNLLAEDQVFESDLLVRNLYHPGNLSAELMGRHFLVECKNWANPVGVRDVGYFLYRMRLTHAIFGVIFASSGVTGNTNDEKAARGLIRKAFHEDGNICIILSRTDLNALADGRVTFWPMLLERIERLRFGRVRYSQESNPLTDIGGIGDRRASQLSAYGICSLEDLVQANANDVANALSGISPNMVRAWQEEAKERIATV